MTCVPAGAPRRPATGRRATGSSPRAPGCPADPAVLRRVERALDVVDRRRRRPGSGRAAAARRRPAAGNSGSPSSTRLTLATVPGVRMLPARQRSDGPSVTGSTRPVSRRFGSTPETIAGRLDLLAARRARRPWPRRRSRVMAATRAAVPDLRAGGAAPPRRARRRAPTDRPARTPSRPPPRRRCRRSRRAAPRSSPPTTGPSPCSGRRARRASRADRARSRTTRATKSATAIASTRRIVRPSSLPRPAERPPEPQARGARRRSPAP